MVQFYDRRHGRVSVLSPDGDLAYEISLVGAQGRPLHAYRAADTTLVALYPVRDTAHVIARSDDGELRGTQQVVVLHDLTGTRSDTVIRMAGARSIETEQSSMRPVWGLASLFAVLAGGEFAVATGDAYSVSVVDERGDTRRIHRLNRARRAIDRDSLLRILGRDERAAAMLNTTLDDHPMLAAAFLPDSQPAFKAMRVFGDELWLGSAEPFNLPPRTWQVLSRSGEWLAEVGVPDNIRILDVRDDIVVVARTGEYDEQTLHVYSLAEGWKSPGAVPPDRR